jgi:ATP-dependent DNA helicase RecQ
VVLPTGGGKSLCYQLPALLPREKPALCVAVSPLNALMKDQVEALQTRGITDADYLCSLQSQADTAEVLARLAAQKLRLLYVSPERFLSSWFREALSRNRIGLFAVDEAHCISQWGHDFRPEYRELRAHLNAFPGARRLALTATATPRVADDIVASLGLRDPVRVIESFDRPNLSFEILPCTPGDKGFVIQKLLQETEGSAIIYVGKRGDAESLAAELKSARIDAAPYHAGLSRELRHARQDKFLAGDLRVLCATVAFGMGIDKPDVRLVAHHRLPASVESYYQEAGRAGRDGQPARCALLYHGSDLALQEWFLDQACPNLAFHIEVRDRVRRGTTDRGALLRALDVTETRLQVALGGLMRAGLLAPDEGGDLSTGDVDDLEALESHLAELEQRRAQGQRLLSAVQSYAVGSGCRRAALLRYFGEIAPARCDKCSGCKAVEMPRRKLRRGEKACPECNAPMVKRKSDRGTFYGCSAFPSCRGTRPGRSEAFSRR